MGSAGGAINSNAHATAGSGGGIVLILAGTVKNDGTITSRGTAGGYTHHQAAGGGAGGSIFVYAANEGGHGHNYGALKVDGGAGGVDPVECSVRPTGGAGSSGRIYTTSEPPQLH